jgi:DHA1 family quinolone resistance protein-like MFS transporter
LVSRVKPEAVQFLSSTGLFGPVIIVPAILQNDLGATKDLIGIIAGGYAALGFASSYMFGRASDVYGRRLILLAGLLLSGVATLLQVISLVSGGLVFFAGVRLLIGFCSGMFPAALTAYAYDAQSKMGKFSAWGAAGWGIGNLSVGLFGSLYEWAYIYCAAIIFASFAIALTLPFTRNVKMEVPLFPVALIRRNAPVYTSMLIRHTGANMIWVTYPLFLASIGADATWIGIIYAVNAFGQFFIMNMLDKYDPSLLVAVGLASSALTFFAFELAGSYWEIIPSQILLASAWACLYVGSLRYVMDRNPEKATASGILSSTMSISGVIGPILGGVAATAVGFKGTIWIAITMSVVALAIFLSGLRSSGELYRLTTRSRGSR